MSISLRPIEQYELTNDVIFDITEFILSEAYWHFDAFGNIKFIHEVNWTINLKINHFGVYQEVKVDIKIPKYIKKSSRIFIMKYEFNDKFTCIVSSSNSVSKKVISLVQCYDSSEIPEDNIDNNNLQSIGEDKMFKSFEIEKIKLELAENSEVSLNDSTIIIAKDKVTIKANNKTKTVGHKEFITSIQEKFKNAKIKDLTNSEIRFLNDSGLVKSITLNQLSDINELLF